MSANDSGPDIDRFAHEIVQSAGTQIVGKCSVAISLVRP
jgi:hypothetical protein